MAEFETNSHRTRYKSTSGGDLPENETEYFYSRRASMDEFSDSGAHNNYTFDSEQVLNELNERRKMLEETSQQQIDKNGLNTPISRSLSQSSFMFLANE